MGIIATIIAAREGTSSTAVQAVLQETPGVGRALDARVTRGQFCCIPTRHGLIMGTVVEITADNSYFENAQTVREYERSGTLLGANFPTAEWEYHVATIQLLGVFRWAGGPRDAPRSLRECARHLGPKVDRIGFPPSPGDQVHEVPDAILSTFLGFDQADGVELGTLRNQALPAKLDLHRLLNKHLAILAISGAGKSYLTTVLIEELLARAPAQGRPAVVIFDVHGEYTSLERAELGESGKTLDVKVVDGLFLQFAVPFLSPWDFLKYQPNISPVQARELAKVVGALRKDRGHKNRGYDLGDIMDAVAANEEIGQKTREVLNGWLYLLKRTGYFGAVENPNLARTVRPGRALVFNLAQILSVKKRQMVVNYFLSRLFKLRREGAICPFVVIVEEAHQLCPEGKAADYALSRGIIETVAREGRKFFAQLCLISQRPVKLSTTALSQCNTHVILRVVNPYDLDHIKASSEFLTRDAMKLISTLPVGECLVVGSAVNYPVFVQVRRRHTTDPTLDRRLEDVARKYEEIHAGDVAGTGQAPSVEKTKITGRGASAGKGADASQGASAPKATNGAGAP